MPTSNWTELPLEDCLEKLIDYRGKTPKKTTDGIPLVTARIVKGGRIARPTEFIAQSDYDAWMRRGIPNSGDVLITTEAPLGEVAQLENARVALAQRLIALRGKPGLLDNTFLRFLMQSNHVQHQLVARASGTTVLGIKQSELRKVILRFPCLAEQKAIANILGTLDDKIELNRRMNETLESITRAIFKSWFVDFDPVRAKLEGQSHVQQSSTSVCPMPAEVYDLFPSAFQDSELGKIPEGWEVKSAEQVADIGIGKTPPRKQKEWFTKSNSDLPWMSIRDLGACDVYISKVKEYLTEEAVQKFNVRRIPNNTVVVSFKLTVGRVAITDGEMLSNEAIAHYKPLPNQQELPPEYLYFYLQQFDYRSLGSTSSIATAVNSKLMKAIPVLVASSEINKHFQALIGPMFTRIKLNQNESETLAQLRDILLPKLLSGELTIPEALLQAEEAL